MVRLLKMKWAFKMPLTKHELKAPLKLRALGLPVVELACWAPQIAREMSCAFSRRHTLGVLAVWARGVAMDVAGLCEAAAPLKEEDFKWPLRMQALVMQWVKWLP